MEVDVQVQSIEVTVTDQTASVAVQESQVVVLEVSPALQGLPGPKGDKGDKGDTGASGNAAAQYEHQQLIASAMWTVNHNLGLRPQISVLSLGGATMWAEVIHASPNQALVYFDEPQAGLAICS